jgi:predicted acetyltransferase
MRWILEQAADRGEAVSVLHASEGAIYPHFGYGMGTLQGSIDADPSAFRFSRPAEPLGSVRLVDVDEAMRTIPAIYDQVRAGRPGEVSRSPNVWRLQLLSDNSWRRAAMGPKSNAVLSVGGEPRGYVQYRVKAEWGDRGPKNTLNVLEVTALDPAAERALWEWLVGIDLVGQVKAWRTPAHNPLLLQVVEPQRLGLTIRDGLWLRLVDVRAALEARTYAGTGRLTLDVTDAFLPSNAGRWTVEVADDRGAASVTSAADAATPDIALDVADLATVYLGAFTFADLARAGRARECRDGAIAGADRLFATPAAPWCSTMF